MWPEYSSVRMKKLCEKKLVKQLTVFESVSEERILHAISIETRVSKNGESTRKIVCEWNFVKHVPIIF